MTGFGVIGAGTWGRNHALVFSSDRRIQLVAVCDTNQAAAEEVAGEYGADQVYKDFREMVANPEIDAVAIATPDFAHFEPVAAAVQAGKHVLVEKPLATNTDEAKQLAHIVKGTDVKIMVDFHNRWNPAMCAAKQAVDSGEIGRPLSAYIRLHDTIFVPTEMLTWADRSSPLWFLGSHCLDLLRWILNDEVKTVYCVCQSGLLKGRGVDTPDAFHTVFQFRNGAVAVMENQWVLPNSEPSIIDFRLDLVGTEGAVNVDCAHNRTVQKYTKDQATYPNMLTLTEVQGRKQGFVLESIRHFVDCVVEDLEPLAGVEDGLINTEVLVAAERSAETGKPVEL